MSSLCQNPELFICILYQNIIFSDSASYFFEMSMLIILVGTMTQLRMWIGCITFPRMGPRRGQYIVLINLEGIPTQIRMRIGSITFYARGSIRGQYVFFMPKS